jgi:membrane protein
VLERRFPVLTALTARLVTVNVLDSATRLAAQVFLTAVPFLFVAAAVAPKGFRDQLVSSAESIFGLSGSSAQQLRDVYADQDVSLRETVGVIGGLMALISATACSRAMARVCERAWGLGRSPVGVAAWRWVVWIATWVLILVAQAPVRQGFGAGPALGVPLAFLASAGEWWWTQHLLLGARVAWLPLLPGALLTGAAMTAMAVTARIYMPTALNRSLSEYGSLGSVFTILSWLIAVCAVVTVTVTAGAVLAQHPPFAARLRGGIRSGGIRTRRRS